MSHMAEFLVYFLFLWLLIKPLEVVEVALDWSTRISLDIALLYWLFRRLFPQKKPLLVAHKKWGGLWYSCGSSPRSTPWPNDAERAEAFVLMHRFRRLIMRKSDLHA